MLKSIHASELVWEFPTKALIRFPVDSWIRIGKKTASVSSLTVQENKAFIQYEQGRIALSLQFEACPETNSILQNITIRVSQKTADLLFDFQFGPEIPDPIDWLTIPGLFYGDNNLSSDRVKYPKDLKVNWSFRADASPCPGLHLPGDSFGYAAFLERDRLDYKGGKIFKEGVDDLMGIGWFNQPQGGRRVRLTFPCQEAPYHFHRPDKLERAMEPRFHAETGDEFHLTVHHFLTEPGRQGYFKPVRVMSAQNRPEWLDRSDMRERVRQTAALFAECLRESHFVPGIGFSHRQDLPEIHSGWSGGFAAVEAGLTYGEYTKDYRLSTQAETMANFICETGVSSIGYFYAEYRDKTWHPNVYWGKAKGLHIRHASEGTLFLGRILRREAERGRTRPEWRKAFYANLDAVLRDQRDDGALPIELDPKTGEVIDWEGTTPGTWVGPLILGSVLAESEGNLAQAALYRSAAERTADYYLENYLKLDRFYGGPYDAYRAPNMEDAYNLLNAYAELYRYTQRPQYLSAARICADHLLSWRYTYDVVFPEGTICQKQAVSTYGTAPASVRNRHLQNWDTVAAVTLTDLSEWTGDPFYARSALDHLVQSCQLVEQGDGVLGIPKGGQSEQWYATEFYWFGSFGHYGKGNLWKVSVVLPKSGFLTAVALLDLGRE